MGQRGDGATSWWVDEATRGSGVAKRGLGGLERLKEYFRRSSYPVTVAYLFGSAAKGRTTALSDLDVAIYLDEPDLNKRVDAYLPLLRDLRLEVGDVDLVLLNDASPLLAREIVAGRPFHCTDERQRVMIETRILSAYPDERDLQQVRHRLLERRVLEGKMGERNGDLIDRRVINERLAYIDAMLAHLKKYQLLSEQAFRADEQRHHAALYELQTCLEAMTDIGNHLIAAMGFRSPQDRGDIFTILAEESILSTALAERLVTAVGMRNIIVHGYLGILLPLVHRTIQKDLGDIESFCQAIVQFMNRVSPDSREEG